MLKYKKIYIDTRFKTSDSKSNSDFRVEIPESFETPDNCVFYVDDVVLPVCFGTINKYNNKVYFDIRDGGGVIREYIATLPNGNYSAVSFMNKLQTVMNAAMNGEEEIINATVEFTYDGEKNIINMTFHDHNDPPKPLIKLFILTDGRLTNGVNFDGRTWNKNELNSINGIIQNYKLDEMYIAQNETSHSGFLDLHTTRNLYLTSSAMSNHNTCSNFNIDTIIKKIPITVGYNQMLFDNVVTPFDYLECSQRFLKRLDFKLVDSFNRTIVLQQNFFTFSLVFGLAPAFDKWNDLE